MQDPEALGGAGEGDVEFGRTTRTVGEDPLRLHHQHGVELQPLGVRRCHRAGHTRWPNYPGGAFAVGLVAHEFLDGSG